MASKGRVIHPFKKGDIVECIPGLENSQAKNGGPGYWVGRKFKIGDITNIVLWPDEKYDKTLYKEGDLSQQQKHDLSNGVYDYAVTLVNDISVIIDKINVELNSL